MPKMDKTVLSSLIASLIESVAVPEIVRFIQARVNAGQPMPTNEEIIAAVRPTLDPYITRDAAFLAEHGIALS